MSIILFFKKNILCSVCCFDSKTSDFIHGQSVHTSHWFKVKVILLIAARKMTPTKPVLTESLRSKVDLLTHHRCVLLTSAGQLSQVGRQFYNTDIEVEILSKEETEKMTYVVCTRAQVKHQLSCRVSDLDPVSISMEMIPSTSGGVFVYTQTTSVYWILISVYWDGTLGKLNNICSSIKLNSEKHCTVQ